MAIANHFMMSQLKRPPPHEATRMIGMRQLERENMPIE